jgi:hypothetical protein
MVGRWYVSEDGHASPSVRTLLRPLLNIFHGERNGKRWKTEVDRILLAPRPAGVPPLRVSEVVEEALKLLDDCVLDAPPGDALRMCEPFAGEQTGCWPPEGLPVATAA